MTLVMLLALLQAPDDLPGFLAQLEKDRAKGASSAELLAALESWAEGKPAEIRARIAWNRTHLETTARLDAVFVESLQRRVGKPVAFGRISGTVREVKKDRMILGVTGGQIEVEFTSIPVDVRIDDLKKERFLPENSLEEAVFRFAGGKTQPALTQARALAESSAKQRALEAFAGFVLQECDRGLAAGKVQKVAEDFGATWAKEADVMGASDGALGKFIEGTLAPRLISEADAVLAKDRKGAKKLLELAAGLCKAPEIASQISERRWGVLEKGEWLNLPLSSMSFGEGKLDGSKVVWEDKPDEKGYPTGIKCSALPVPWEEISGVRARVRPGATVFADIRIGRGEFSYSAGVQCKDAIAFATRFAGQAKPVPLSKEAKPVGTKKEYEFRVEWSGKKWSFFVDKTELCTIDLAGDETASSVEFVIKDGKAELTSLQVRKK
jgi:hypothetical protein